MQTAARTIEDSDMTGARAPATVGGASLSPLAMPVQDLGVGGPSAWSRVWCRIREGFPVGR